MIVNRAESARVLHAQGVFSLDCHIRRRNDFDLRQTLNSLAFCHSLALLACLHYTFCPPEGSLGLKRVENLFCLSCKFYGLWVAHCVRHFCWLDCVSLLWRTPIWLAGISFSLKGDRSDRAFCGNWEKIKIKIRASLAGAFVQLLSCRPSKDRSAKCMDKHRKLGGRAVNHCESLWKTCARVLWMTILFSVFGRPTSFINRDWKEHYWLTHVHTIMSITYISWKHKVTCRLL